MAVRILATAIAVASCWGCASRGTFVSKSTMGNLEINVSAPEGVDVSQTRLFVDGHFIGNVSEKRPVLFVHSGERTIRAELAGFPTYEEQLQVLGDPNHQVLNVVFENP